MMNTRTVETARPTAAKTSTLGRLPVALARQPRSMTSFLVIQAITVGLVPRGLSVDARYRVLRFRELSKRASSTADSCASTSVPSTHARANVVPSSMIRTLPRTARLTNIAAIDVEMRPTRSPASRRLWPSGTLYSGMIVPRPRESRGQARRTTTAIGHGGATIPRAQAAETTRTAVAARRLRIRSAGAAEDWTLTRSGWRPAAASARRTARCRLSPGLRRVRSGAAPGAGTGGRGSSGSRGCGR